MKKIIIVLCCFILSTINAMWRINEGRGLHGLKILHMGFQLGCIKDFEAVAQELSLDVTSWYILSATFKKDFFDGCVCGNQVYNISAERAQRVWDLHKDFFNQFDVIMTSDTAPLSRIFLQNNWQKPLIIWVCNRFDYCHGPHTSAFPDKKFYQLMADAKNRPNVFVIPYTDFEWVYAAQKGIDLGRRTISPMGATESCMRDGTDTSMIPAHINKKETLFLYPRFDHPHQVAFIQDQCKKLGIVTYHGAYNGPKDLEGFKAVIYIPYAWSNVALFENIQRGIVHFVPTASFLQRLHKAGNLIRAQTVGIVFSAYRYCDWYADRYKDLFVYFDSWQELQEKINMLDYASFSQHVAKAGAALRQKTVTQWQILFQDIAVYK